MANITRERFLKVGSKLESCPQSTNPNHGQQIKQTL